MQPLAFFYDFQIFDSCSYIYICRTIYTIFILIYFALNNDYITLELTFQTLITWLSGIVICYSLAVMLQGYVEQKITVFERIAYLAIIALTIVPSPLYSIIGIVLFIGLYGFRVWQAKKGPKSGKALPA